MPIWKKNITVEELNRSLTGIDDFTGLSILEIADNKLVAEFLITEKILQPMGLLHGGVTCCCSETLGSVAANLCVDKGMFAVGMNLQANHLRSARIGERVKLVAQPTHLGSRTQVWSIDSELEDGRLVSRVSFTVSILAKKPRAKP